jgi:transposase
MESAGIYWKSPYAALEAMGIRAKVVNARHVKNVPGRKTDVGMRIGWRRWRVRGFCAGRSCHQRSGVNCA